MQHEAFFTFLVPTRPDGSTEEEYLCTFNHRAMLEVREQTGKDPYECLIGDIGELKRTHILAYACGATFRRGNGYEVSFDDFLDGPYLGAYGSPYWMELVRFLEDLVIKTFPWVVGSRSLIVDTATKLSQILSEIQSTGTDASISPGKRKLSKPRASSGTVGTGPT